MTNLFSLPYYLLLDVTSTNLLADLLQTKILSPKEPLGSLRSHQTLESVGIIWENFMEEEAQGMVGVELVSREKKRQLGGNALGSLRNERMVQSCEGAKISW